MVSSYEIIVIWSENERRGVFPLIWFWVTRKSIDKTEIMEGSAFSNKENPTILYRYDYTTLLIR